MARILLVDDEKLARTLYGDHLVSTGHSVTAVASVKEAKTALRKTRFDVVVTDLILPHGDGMEVLQFAKDEHPGVEVVVITALDKVDPAVRAIKSGAAEYLVKPVAPEALAHAVSRALTTQQLFRENEVLRAHVALLETAQRIATTLDRERLIATALSSFAQVTHADAIAIFVKSASDELRSDGHLSLEGDDGAAVLASLQPIAKRLLSSEQPPASPTIETSAVAPYAAAVGVVASEGGTVLGCVLLLFRKPPAQVVLERAGFLGPHLGLGLRNLGRFAAVEDLAYLDDLTHLFNVRYLELILDREVKGAQQGGKPFSLLFLDLDYFKSVNDTHGHLVGSKLLVEVARIIKGCVRDNDVVCRYGGDEYVVLLRGTDSGGALKVGERIRRTIENHHFLAREGYSLSVTTCIGVASFPEHAADKATLVDFADRAMYRGKKGTRNVIYMAAKGLEATPAQRHSTPTGSPAPETDS